MSQQETIDMIKKIFEAYLENKNLRKTPERFAILEEIYSRTGHFDVESLYISMKNKNYRVSRATVYNTLDILLECDLVTKHQFGKNIAQYEKSFSTRSAATMGFLISLFDRHRLMGMESLPSGEIDDFEKTT